MQKIKIPTYCTDPNLTEEEKRAKDWGMVWGDFPGDLFKGQNK